MGRRWKPGARRPVATPVVLVLVLALAGPARAFDHERHGFVLGLGAGVALYAQQSGGAFTPSSAQVDESSAGVGYQLVIGGGIGDSDWLVYEGNVLLRHSENWDLLMGQGFNGLAWYHGWGVRGHQWVTALGLGAQIAAHDSYYYFSTSPNDPKSTAPPEDPGPGSLLGVGYELRPRLLLMGYCSIGTTKSKGFDASTFRQGHLNVLLQYLWD